MATPVIMQRYGQSVESCLISGWSKQVGDEVHSGDVLFSCETDKAVFDEEAQTDGTLLAIFHGEGDDVPCLEIVAVIGAPGEDYSALVPAGSGAAAPREEPREPDKAPPAAACAGRSAGVSPRARAAADRGRVDLASVSPTGPHGRVIERDVLAAKAASAVGTGLGGRVRAEDLTAAPAAAPALESAGFRDEKLSHLRQVIGGSMHRSLAEMAQLTHHSSFDAACIMAYRGQLKAAAEAADLPNITYNDILLYAVSRVLKHHPALNAHLLEGGTMRYFDHVHLGMAVDTPRGLLVPTIFGADTMSLAQISVEAKALASAAQNGSIAPDLLTGATFTLSNLGALGVELFTPVINPPQTGILGVGRIVDRVRSAGGQISVYPAMGLSLTYDHRALDGAPASRFLQELAGALEHFTALLAK